MTYFPAKRQLNSIGPNCDILVSKRTEPLKDKVSVIFKENTMIGHTGVVILHTLPFNCHFVPGTHLIEKPYIHVNQWCFAAEHSCCAVSLSLSLWYEIITAHWGNWVFYQLLATLLLRMAESVWGNMKEMTGTEWIRVLTDCSQLAGHSGA
jgi:hypothetical protein